jgi:putative DNA primase/helicase
MQAVVVVRAFIAAHGASRFELIGGSDDQKVINRAGWKRLTNGGLEYLITPDCWKTEICLGLSHKRVADAVNKAGFLLGASDRHRQALQRIEGHGPVRVYVVSGTILEGGDDGE